MRKIYFILFLIATLGNVTRSQSTQHVLLCRTYGNPAISQAVYNQIGYFLDNNPVEYNGCQLNSAITVAVIDSNCIVWNNCNHNFGQANVFTLGPGQTCGPLVSGTGTCRARPENYFIFRFDDPVQMDSLSSMLNQIPNGFYVLAYTWYNYMYSMVPNFKLAFQNIGALSISSLPDTVPYIFFIKKGDPTSVVEVFGILRDDMITLTQNISCITTGLEELNKNSISIYPNPITEMITISNNISGKQITRVLIYDAVGKIVIIKNIDDGPQSINVSSITNGVYFIKFITKDNEALINKFVKE